jgi:hypothetical protein
VAKYEKLTSYFDESDQYLFDQFVSDSRSLLDEQNYNFPELGIRNDRWVIPWLVDEDLTIPRIKPLGFKPTIQLDNQLPSR